LWLEVDAAAFDIVAYMVAVFFGGEPRDSEFAAVDAQPRNVHGFRRCGICNLNDLLKVFVGLRLARARVSLKKVLVLLLSLPPCSACRLSRFRTTRPRPNSGQLVRRHGHLAARNESAKGGTRPVWRLVAGL
jgi:hypothetical protein